MFNWSAVFEKLEEDFQIRSYENWLENHKAKLLTLQEQINHKVNHLISQDLETAKKFVPKDKFSVFCDLSAKERLEFIAKEENSQSPTPYGRIDLRTLQKILKEKKMSPHERIKNCFLLLINGKITLPANESYLLSPQVDDLQYKLNLFINTNWKVYYYHYHEDLRRGFLGMALLMIEGYDNVQLLNPNSENSNHYLGEIFLEGSNQHISIDLGGVFTKEKHLRITAFVGIDNVHPLLLGVYTNIHSNNAMVAGTLVLEKVADSDQMKTLSPQIIEFGEANKNGIDSNITRYLQNKSQNMIKIPSSILSKQKLERWFKSQT